MSVCVIYLVNILIFRFKLQKVCEMLIRKVK